MDGFAVLKANKGIPKKILSALVSFAHNQQHINPRGPIWQAAHAVCHSAGSQVQDESDMGRTN